MRAAGDGLEKMGGRVPMPASPGRRVDTARRTLSCSKAGLDAQKTELAFPVLGYPVKSQAPREDLRDFGGGVPASRDPLITGTPRRIESRIAVANSSFYRQWAIVTTK